MRATLVADGTAHGDAAPPGEAASLFVLADAAIPIADLSLSHDLESEPLIIGRVPRDVGVGGQRQSSESALFSPRSGGVQQGPPETPPGMFGVNGDLLDMGIPIDDVDKEVGHGTIRIVSNDPGATILLEGDQVCDGRWSIVCDGTHAQVSKRRTRCALDLLNSR